MKQLLGACGGALGANSLTNGLPKWADDGNSTLEVRTILADANFEILAHSEMRWEGDHLRIVLTVNDSKAIDKLIVSAAFLTMDAKSWCTARCLLHAPIAFVV